jgi:HEAT repeat protein
MRAILASMVSLLCLTVSAQAADTAALVKQLRSKDVEERRQAAKDFQDEGIDAKLAVPALVTALKDSDHIVRRLCATALGQFGEQSKSVIAALAALANDDEKSVANAALEALGKMGADALPTLNKVARNPKMQIDMRVQAVSQIGTLKVDKDKKMTSFADMLKTSIPAAYNPTATKQPPDTSIRIQVVKSMSVSAGDAAVVAPILSKMLVTDDDPDVRLEVIKMLGGMGADAKVALRELNKIIESTREQDMLCRDAAKETVEKIEGKKP